MSSILRDHIPAGGTRCPQRVGEAALPPDILRLRRLIQHRLQEKPIHLIQRVTVAMNTGIIDPGYNLRSASKWAPVAGIGDAGRGRRP